MKTHSTLTVRKKLRIRFLRYPKKVGKCWRNEIRASGAEHTFSIDALIDTWTVSLARVYHNYFRWDSKKKVCFLWLVEVVDQVMSTEYACCLWKARRLWAALYCVSFLQCGERRTSAWTKRPCCVTIGTVIRAVRLIRNRDTSLLYSDIFVTHTVQLQ